MRAPSRPPKSKQQQAAEARARGLLKERDQISIAAFERVQLRRRAERLERVRARTRALAARARSTAAPAVLPFEETG